MPIRPNPDNRSCSECGTYETYINKPKNSRPYPDWRKNKKGELICKKCWNNIIWNPMWDFSEGKKQHRKKMFTYNRARIILYNEVTGKFAGSKSGVKKA